MASSVKSRGPGDASGGTVVPADTGHRPHPANNGGGLSDLKRYYARFVRRRAWNRIADAIACYRSEIAARERTDTLVKSIDEINGVLDKAEGAVAAGNIELAWRCLHVAKRQELFTLGDPELKAVATAMVAEADKLNAWRKAAVAKLLIVCPGQEGPDVDSVYRAALLRDEHYTNQAHKDGVRRTTALWLASALLVIGGAGITFVTHANFLDAVLSLGNISGGSDDKIVATVTCVALFGFLGAAVSAVTTTGGAGKSSRIPEMISTIRVTTLRLLAGPISAVVVYFAVASNLYGKIVSVAPDGYALLVIAFAAGFTERLVRRVVETVAG